MRSEVSEQEQLFVTTKDNGITIARDFSESEANVGQISRIEQKIHLINCIGYIAQANMYAGAETGPQGVRDYYGERADQVISAASSKRAESILRAQWEFARATGRFEMEESGAVAPIEARKITRELFSDFLRKYFVPALPGSDLGVDGEPKITWQQYRNQLRREIKELQLGWSVKHRSLGVRPHAPSPTRIIQPDEGETNIVPALSDNRSRLEAILGDERAEFLPFTHQEKNLTMTFLDYLDNPEYPIGINNQLFEVFIHQQRQMHEGSKHGVRAMESIVWQIGDYLANAVQSLSALQQLERTVLGVRPDILVQEEGITPDHPGFVALVRYMALNEFLHTGAVAGLPRDILRTAEERWTREGEGKHKTMHDQWFRPDRKEAFNRYLAKHLKSITVKQAMEGLRQATDNELQRIYFMADRLHDIEILQSRSSMDPVTKAASASLEVLEEPKAA